MNPKTNSGCAYPHAGSAIHEYQCLKQHTCMLQVVLIENDIDARPFSSQVLACLPPLPWSASAEDIANPIRQDLRHIRVFSVDPPGI